MYVFIYFHGLHIGWFQHGMYCGHLGKSYFPPWCIWNVKIDYNWK